MGGIFWLRKFSPFWQKNGSVTDGKLLFLYNL